MSNRINPEELMGNLLTLDDTFAFRCVGCGRCCIHREDILLTARDLFRASKHLNIQTAVFVKRYCECYIGDTSRLPIVRLKPVGADHHCPMLNGKKCLIHAAKPVVCALFPLGRAEMGETTSSDELNTVYFKQDVSCPTNRNTTVRKWLERFGIEENDVFQKRWSQMLVETSAALQGMLKHENAAPKFEEVYNILFFILYIHYDISLPLDGQFEQNMLLANELITKAEQMFPPKGEGQDG